MKLGITTPQPNDATSWYRAMGVFGPLARENGIELVPGDTWDWHRLAYCDVLFMHRPFSDAHLELATLARHMRVPLWVDFDDDLFSIDGSLPSFVTYGNDEAKRRIADICGLAAVVTVSTRAIAESMWPSAVVVPNAFNNYFCGFSDRPRERNIVWRGGVTAFDDLDGAEDGIALATEAFPDWHWHFIGVPPKAMARAIPAARFHVHGYRELFPYFQLLYSLRSAVMIKPLRDCQFNRAKSNCAWLEASGAGAVMFAPKMDEWLRPGVWNYGADFGPALCRLLAAPDETRAQSLRQSRTYIKSELTLSTVNQQRFTILRQLTTNKHKDKIWDTGMTAGCPTALAR